MNGQNQYASAGAVTSDPTQRAPDIARRLAEFRHAVGALRDEPTKSDLDALLALAKALPLRDEEIAEELESIRAALEGLALRDALRAGEWPLAASPDPLPTGEACHIVLPVRFGRRRADQFGHLVLTSRRLRFRGALDVGVAWSEVQSVGRESRDVIVALRDSRRLLRFSCHSVPESIRAAVIAQHLARLAASPPEAEARPFDHASL